MIFYHSCIIVSYWLYLKVYFHHSIVIQFVCSIFISSCFYLLSLCIASNIYSCLLSSYNSLTFLLISACFSGCQEKLIWKGKSHFIFVPCTPFADNKIIMMMWLSRQPSGRQCLADQQTGHYC